MFNSPFILACLSILSLIHLMSLVGNKFKDDKLQEIHKEYARHIALVGIVCLIVAIFFNKGELIPFPSF